MTNYIGGRKGGRLPENLLEAFDSAVELFMGWDLFFDPLKEPTVTLDDRMVPISRICGLVWNCTDLMPKRLMNEVFVLEHRLAWIEARAPRLALFTYACGARKLRRLIRYREIHGPAVWVPSTDPKRDEGDGPSDPGGKPDTQRPVSDLA
jgi:hypothetical protein